MRRLVARTSVPGNCSPMVVDQALLRRNTGSVQNSADTLTTVFRDTVVPVNQDSLRLAAARNMVGVTQEILRDNPFFRVDNEKLKLEIVFCFDPDYFR